MTKYLETFISNGFMATINNDFPKMITLLNLKEIDFIMISNICCCRFTKVSLKSAYLNKNFRKF